MPSTSDKAPAVPAAAWLGIAAVCAYVLAFRVYDIADNYPMLGEQIRDWSIAQRPFRDLPLVGPRSLNSGLDIGPAYYWVLWAGRVLLTPVVGPLPHTGGWVVAVFATIADGVLLAALWRRLGSFWLAAGIVVFAATAAPDASLSAVVWNPPIAAAFAKLAIASVLWPGCVTIGRSVATVALVLGAMQCHASGVLIAIPLLGWILWAAARDHGTRAAIAVVVATALGLGLWAAAYIGQPPVPRATDAPHVGVMESLAAITADPLTRLRPLESAQAVSGALQFIFTAPYTATWFGPLLLICALIAIATIRDGVMLAVGVLPLLTAVAVFSLWQGPFGEVYWFLVIVPATALCLASPIQILRGHARAVATMAFLAVTVALQVPRAQHIRASYRLPAYGPLARGAAAAAATGITVRGIAPAFTVPDGMDPLFMFSQAGGRIDADAPVTLVIRPDGSIEYASAR